MTTRPDTVAALTELAAEAIRSACHRTIEPGQLLVPEVYTILSDLTSLAGRLAQLHQQLAVNLDRRLQLGGLGLDSYGEQQYPDTSHAIAAAVHALQTAACAAMELATANDDAHNACAVLADTAPSIGGRS